MYFIYRNAIIIHLLAVKTCPELPPTSTINLTYSKHSLPNKSLPVRYSPGTKVSTACKDSTNQLMGSKEMLCTQEGIWEGYKDGMSCRMYHLLYRTYFIIYCDQTIINEMLTFVQLRRVGILLLLGRHGSIMMRVQCSSTHHSLIRL